MKKVLALITVLSLVLCMGIVSSFADARDEIYLVNEANKDVLRGGEDKGGFGTFGSNDMETELGDISDKIAANPDCKVIAFWGWRGSLDMEISAFGYSINDGDIVWDKSACVTTGADVKAAGGEYASRFLLKVPIYTGDVTVSIFVQYEDDPEEYEDMEWYIYYTNNTDVGNGAAPTPAPTPTPTATPEATATPVPTPTPTVAPTEAPTAAPTEAPAKTGCGSVIGSSALLVAALAVVVLKKRK